MDNFYNLGVEQAITDLEKNASSFYFSKNPIHANKVTNKLKDLLGKINPMEGLREMGTAIKGEKPFMGAKQKMDAKERLSMGLKGLSRTAPTGLAVGGAGIGLKKLIEEKE